VTQPRLLQVDLSVERAKELLDRIYPNGKLGGLMIDGGLPGALGQKCDLLVRIATPPRHLNVKGQIAWARHKGSRALRECFGVDFVLEDEAGRARMLAAAKEEVQADAMRFEERVATELPVRLFYDGKKRQEFLCDLSQGGAFVRTFMPLPVGATLEMDVRPPRALLRIRLKGRVAWVRQTGAARGMGIEFVFDAPDQATRVRGLLEKISRV
jgi:uncharacterized protein (TIGR02266 family)